MAIALTCVLFTALFTIGGSMVKSMQQGTMRQVGTSAHAGFKAFTQAQYDKLRADPKIKDISYNIYISNAENEALAKVNTEIRWTEEKDAKWSFCEPTTGTLPKNRLDLATSTAVLDALGVPHQLGAAAPLEFTANGVHHSETFTLCGFWNADKASPANEAYVSREYCDEVAPVIQKPLYESANTGDFSDMAGTINPSFFFRTSWNIDSQVDALMKRCGFDPQYVNLGVNWAYASSSVDAQTLMLVALVLLLILFSGYLIIYNIFYISVSRDIRFYGLLKTIGTTGRQLKRIVRRQALTLGVVGIPAGLILGWLCGKLLMPTVIKSTNRKDFSMVSSSPLIFIGAAAFTLLTILISCIRPGKIAAKVSPVEAVHYTEVGSAGKKAQKKSGKVAPISMAIANLRRGRKKTIVIVLSLSLSMVLVNSVYTVVKGFDMDKFLSEQVASDFIISDASIRNAFSADINTEGVTPEALDAISKLEGVEAVGSVYMKSCTYKLDELGDKNTMKIIEEYQDTMPMPYVQEDLRAAKEDHTLQSNIYGLDEFTASKLEIFKGKLDMKKFLSGKYVVVSSYESEGGGRYYNVGDKVTLDFGNGNTKEYEVLAVGDIPYALGPHFSSYLGINFSLPASEYASQFGKTQPLCTAFDVDDGHDAQTETWIADYCKNTEPNLAYTSRGTYVEAFRENQRMYSVVGGALSLILALIGVLNFINAIVTSVISRRRELATLQSVGMTGKQLRKMLICEGLSFAALTVFFTATIGSLVGYGLVKLMAAQIWFFTWHFTLLPLVCCIPVLILISAAVPAIIHKSVSRQSVVERLREAE